MAPHWMPNGWPLTTPAIVAAYTVTRPGFRRFRINTEIKEITSC